MATLYCHHFHQVELRLSHFAQQPQSLHKLASEVQLQADKAVLAPKKGVFGGLGERGVGGSKCGATGAVAVVYKNASGKASLLTANAGDARVVLARKGKAVQLTEDHVPDM